MPLYNTGVQLESLFTFNGELKRSPVVVSNIKLDVIPSSTSIETMDTYTIPAGAFAADGDQVEILWGFEQSAANSCTITVESPSGVALLADARSTVCDRFVSILYERVSATKLRRHMRYLYGTSVWYVPAKLTDIANATAAVTALVKLTNATAASNCRVVSRRVTYYPAVA